MSMISKKFSRLESKLHEDAISNTGLDEFGDPAYRDGLRALLEAFDTDLQLTERGWQSASDRIRTTLMARLYTQESWAQHPEVFTTTIDRPIVITGLPRSGTTALHRLMSVDPQFQGLETWLLQAPTIRPPRDTWEAMPLYQACVANLKALNTRVPDLRKAHEFAAFEVAECTRVLMQSFVSGVWAESYVVPTYANWIQSQCDRVSYYRHSDTLRLIGAQDMNRRWLLKSPHHMFHIDALLEVFPDACIIQTHRDPLQAIPSVCSLSHMYWRDLEGRIPWSKRLGPWKCAHWNEALVRIDAARQSTTRSEQFFDVEHWRFLVDPLGTVRSIYEHFGLTLSRSAEHQMAQWINKNPTSKHGKHQYTAEAWGVTNTQIREIFAEYRQRHQFDEDRPNCICH